MKNFKIISLLAAGLVSNATAKDVDENNTSKNSENDEFLKTVNSISEIKNFTLNAHRSHSSHSSHGSYHSSHSSHSSHRSGWFRPPDLDNESQANLHGDINRNDLSTPANTILPSSPGIFKVKNIKGSSKDFKLLVTRVQLALSNLGYEIGSVNGSLNAKTMAAIYKYQENKNLIPSGQITDELVKLLEINAI